MRTKSLEKNNLVLLIFIFGAFLFYYQSCDGVVFLEYINLFYLTFKNRFNTKLSRKITKIIINKKEIGRI